MDINLINIHLPSQTLVRLGAYHNLDLTMSQALARRSSDFPGVVTCTPDDSLASVFALIRMRRIHRLVVVEGGKARPGDTPEEAQGRQERKGRLLGIISLSDVLRHVIVSAGRRVERRCPSKCGAPVNHRSCAHVFDPVLQGDVEIGGGGVGAIPVEYLLEAQERHRLEGLNSRRGSQEDSPASGVSKAPTPIMGATGGLDHEPAT